MRESIARGPQFGGRKRILATKLVQRYPCSSEVSVAFIQMELIWLKGKNVVLYFKTELSLPYVASSTNILQFHVFNLRMLVHNDFHQMLKLANELAEGKNWRANVNILIGKQNLCEI